MDATHTYTGAHDPNGDPIPLTGLECQILERHGADEMGFDVLIDLDVTAEELAARYAAASQQTTLEEIVDFHTDPNYPDRLTTWANEGRDLTPITEGSETVAAQVAADHLAVVHPDGSACPDGCDSPADPQALTRYLGGSTQ